MVKFVKLKNGNYINADMIVEIEKVTNGKYTSYEVYMRERLSENVSQEELSNILKASEKSAIYERRPILNESIDRTF